MKKEIIAKKEEIQNFFKYLKYSPIHIQIKFWMLITSYIIFILLFINSIFVTLTFPIIEFFMLMLSKFGFKHRKNKFSILLITFCFIYIIKSFVILMILN